MTDRTLLIAGPTASGKSGFAMAVAERFDGIVINADSMQVYEELRILTARPSRQDEARVPHRLYGVMPANQRCSVAVWLELARVEIANTQAAGKVPILVGGTGLYFSALTDGLAAIPEIPEQVRALVAEKMQKIGPIAMHAELQELDAEMALRLKSSDAQRLIRAHEVLEATGRSLAHWQDQPNSLPGLSQPWFGLALLPDRQNLYEKCDARLCSMIEAGALEEVSRLADMELSEELPAMKALGVPQILSHLRGEISLETAINQAQTATRRYAKRQFTWINNKMIAWNKENLKDSERKLDEIFAKISEFLLTGAK